ncbi:immunity protein YezG family protein, partial [Kitasatospora sp. SC0581]|uniref:immunity protein YezG family protein n=1 Tax=Kitasatospora sp. SC0581 TaxID=3394360 RepID=UPI003A8AC69B
DLTDIFDNIDPSRYNELKYKLYDLCEKLWVEFKKQGQEQWTSLTYILENTGKMNIHFTYNDLSQLDPIKKQDKWEDEYLNNE